MIDEQLRGRRALVTGASSGIGQELATVLAEQGCDLVIVARRETRLHALAKTLRARFKVDVRVEAVDLSSAEAITDLFARTEGAGTPINMLVNNAGLGTYEDFVATSWEDIERQLRVNVEAVTLMCHLFSPPMVARGRGYIMNIASMAAYTPIPGYATYAATKAFVRNFTETLDYELRGTGVRSICINPGGTQTEFTDRAKQALTPRGQRMMMSARRCAEISVTKMLAGRRNVVTGRMNALSMWLLRFLPRSMYPALTKAAMDMAVTKVSST